jgi:hypothetical protein
MNMQTY